LSLITFFYGCASNEIGESKDVAQETIYQQYNISYNEGEENATVIARFRFAGDEGTTLVLNQPSSVQFDGVALSVDSSDFEGAFYKKSLSAGSFFGNHQFSFTDINKRKYDNDFSFDLFSLVDIPESADKNQPLYIPFKPLLLGPGDYIELGTIDTDSSFSVTYSAKDTSGFITIPLEELQRQKGEQLIIAATLYRKYPLQQHTPEGGMLEMEYALKPVTIKLGCS
jgi:hypothetical protein